MLIKSQVKRMHVLNNCVSNGFIYLLYMTRFVCTIWSQDCFIIFPVDYWVAYGQTQSRSAFCLFVFFFFFFLVFFFFFRVGKSFACHSPGKWCLCA